MGKQTVGGAEVTPALVAELFWELDSEQQADFFEHLEGIAGHSLCQQMAYTVVEIHRRADKGDHQAQNGFQTMLSHSADFVLSGIELRTWSAEHEIVQLAKRAKVLT